ncbi:hypothetical protein GUJ93_ZPchr0002g26829 [Zizania palustris]|uniref:Protein kinase domain-containing protein n=1 Tax=Zizania palustris TaxID=103762 RepID=A0A8J5RUU4_ZIZPA|nr:hypothetical protein GUJ93_ZPchr0002g26829 [Zizania palustris]
MEWRQLVKHPGHLLLCFAAVWILVASAANDVAPASRRPSYCQRWCGDIDVPYPFGLDADCAIHTGFQLNCTTVNGSLKLFRRSLEVSKISIPDGKIWVNNMNLSSQCYDPETNTTSYNISGLIFSTKTYWLSHDDNKIVVIGCNALAYLWSFHHVIGCYSTCNDNNPKNSTCNGAGCCQADVPKGIQTYYQGYFNKDYNYTTSNGTRSRCNYVAVMEAASFNFSTTYLTSTEFSDTYYGKVPVVLDWIMGWNTTCEAAKNTTSYACVSSNSDCVDVTNNQQGYRCKCSSGFEGNPYITDGCKDIDECNAIVPRPCPEICTNRPGNYTCTCHKGKHLIDGTCQHGSSSRWIMPVIGASVGIVTLVIIVTCAYLFQERKKLHRIKDKYFQQHGGLLLFEEMKARQGILFKIFSEEELQKATNKFDEEQILGEGGQGTVYKGLLNGNIEVAVKKCKTIDQQKKKEFGKEMLILSQANHKNIVKLLGCCLEVEVPILVYEFIPNGTLFDLIHHGNHGRHISVSTRLQIAHQSAEALAYLHSCASPPILHGDIKSSNILLDSDFTAKVSDFGASILAATDEAQFVTFVQGTHGYLDPEYMLTWKLTDKSDVYSFGVVLLELLTRKKAFDFGGLEDEKCLSKRFLSAVKMNKLENIFDDEIKREENMEVLEELAGLAKRCLEMSGENRPSMKEVAENLDSLRKLLHHPWAPLNFEENESLLGESSNVNSEIIYTGNFSIEKKSKIALESGR